MSKGTLYGVGVGPGDPELLTLKAARLLRDCDIIAIPQKKERCFALRIVLDALPELADKSLLEIVMPMTRDKDARERAHQKGAAALAEQLDKDLNVVYITLGDPTIYSTYGYLQRRIQEMGYETETVPGVPSFCAVAAALDISLCEDRNELHLLPGGINAD
ncbi:MAG: precorrin-2 C(20)-methyltransferase [Oscillospiraceae bacterium]|nr:precorrin-2 C(20)-methyltransferase [Oscillospiraceae bacterium]